MNDERKEMNMIEMKTEGMTCGSCAARITRAVKAIDPEAKVQVDLRSQKVSIESTEDAKALSEAIEEAGYPVLSSTG